VLKYANGKNILDIDSCRNFPQGELRFIDQLWLKHSQNRFGLSVQKQIWIELGGKLDGSYDEDTYCKLGDKVGWRKGGNWLNYSELTFNTSALPGHLPRLTLIVWGRVTKWGGKWSDERTGYFLFYKLLFIRDLQQ
jgi:hypothetical protein